MASRDKDERGLFAPADRDSDAAEVARLTRELRASRSQLAETRDHLDGVLGSFFWRATAPMRLAADRVPARWRHLLRGDVRGFLRGPAPRPEEAGASAPPPRTAGKPPTALPPGRLTLAEPDGYADWVRDYDTLGPEDRVQIRGHIERFRVHPEFSLVLLVDDDRPDVVFDTIRSIQNQLYEGWQAIVLLGPRVTEAVEDVLAREAADDRRISLATAAKEALAARAINAAVAGSRGGFVAFMRGGDRLAPQALYEMAACIGRHSDAAILFSDDDGIDELGGRILPSFKPGWDPELLLQHDYIRNLVVYRRSLFDQAGGFRDGWEDVGGHDLLLRASRLAAGGSIRHLATILFHRRQERGQPRFLGEPPERADLLLRMIAGHLPRDEDGNSASVEAHPAALGMARVRWPLPAALPKVSVIIPTRNKAGLLEGCVRGLLERTDYDNLEIVIVDNGSDEPEALSLLRSLAQDARVQVIRDDGAFNYSRLNNEAVARTRGEILLFLNNDVEVIEGSWLKEMVSQALRPGVGTVGARLLFPDGSVQHGGVLLGIGDFQGLPGIAANVAGAPTAQDPGHGGQMLLTRGVSASTAACLAVPREIFDRVGGFDAENLAVEYNDIDFAIRVSEAGFRHVWTPFAELYHHERASRGPDLSPEAAKRSRGENFYMRARWRDILDADPFVNANFSRLSHRAILARPQRRLGPWRMPRAT